MSELENETTPVIISALTAIEDSNRLRYSSDGNDVILRTRMGDMSLTSNEFTFYQLLFKIADITNSGRLTPVNSHLATLLTRTRLSTVQLDTILSHVNGRANTEGNEVQGLSFNQWLVLCKLISYTQFKSITQEGYVPDEHALEQLHISSELLPVGDFSFGMTDVLPLGSIDDFICEIKGYKVHGEGFQHQHLKFTIATITTTITTPILKPITTQKPSTIPLPVTLPTTAPKSSSQNSKSSSKSKKDKNKQANRPTNGVVIDPPQSAVQSQMSSTTTATVKQLSTMSEVVRRYSDFELLATVLHKFYPGTIIPPLPPKAWGFNSVADSIGVQRSRELQMFLTHITKHPILRHTYEVKAFLEASAAGFRAFRDLFPRLDQGSYSLSFSTYTNPTTNYSMVNNIIDTSSSAISLAATTTSAIASSVTTSISQTKAYGFVSNLFGTVRNVMATPLSIIPPINIAPTTTTSFPKENAKLEQTLRDALRFEENLGKMALKLEQVMITEGKMTFELSQFGYYLKQMADYGSDVHHSSVDIDIQHTCEHIELMVAANHKSLDSQVKNSLSPIQYSGRYYDSLKASVIAKETIEKEIESAAAKEASARKAWDEARTSTTQSDMVTSIFHDQFDDATRSLSNLKKREEDMTKCLETNLGFLQGATKQELQTCTQAFVTSRVESCQQNLEILEKLHKILLDSKSWRPEVSGILVLDEFV